MREGVGAPSPSPSQPFPRSLLGSLLEKRSQMMETWKEKGGKEFCANEPHSETANSLHSLGACENPADKEKSVSGCRMTSVTMDGHLFRRGGKRGEGWPCPLGRGSSLLNLKCFSLPVKGPNDELGGFFSLGKENRAVLT